MLNIHQNFQSGEVSPKRLMYDIFYYLPFKAEKKAEKKFFDGRFSTPTRCRGSGASYVTRSL